MLGTYQNMYPKIQIFLISKDNHNILNQTESLSVVVCVFTMYKALSSILHTKKIRKLNYQINLSCWN